MNLLSFNIGDETLLNLSGTKNFSNSLYNQEGGSFFPIFWIIIKNLYALTGVVLFLFILIGGVGMILNAGNPEKQKQGSKTVTSAVVGYFIMFAAYWLVKIIQTIFGLSIL